MKKITKEMIEKFIAIALHEAELVRKASKNRRTINQACGAVAAQLAIPGFWECTPGDPHVGGDLGLGAGAYDTIALYDGLSSTPLAVVYENNKGELCVLRRD